MKRWTWLTVAATVAVACGGGGTGGPGGSLGGSPGDDRNGSDDGGGAGDDGTSSSSGGGKAGGSGASSGGSGGGSGSGSSGGSSGTGSGGHGEGTGSGSGGGGDDGGPPGMTVPEGDGGPSGCGETLPAVTDYSQNGPFQTTTADGTGPDGKYTVYRPATLGQNGFKHPIAMWGNGITTTPQLYPGLLGAVASHGIVVLASDSTSVTAQNMTDGLDWMVQQNSASGDYQGKLDTKCLVSIGYSLGGGAAVTAGAHANVVVTASLHGVTGNSAGLHAPLLLVTSTTDTFVVPATFVTPTFNASAVQTFYATLSDAGDPSNLGHLLPVGDAGPERAPFIAWLRLWVYGDQGARKYFYGDDCILCQAPWTMPQRKNWK